MMNDTLFAFLVVPWALASCAVAVALILINALAEIVLPNVLLEFAHDALESAFQRMADRGI